MLGPIGQKIRDKPCKIVINNHFFDKLKLWFKIVGI